jgi:hypothetical protein
MPLPNPDRYLVSANGKLGDPPQSAISEVGRILDLAAASPHAKRLVIHFRGGLVDREYALSNIVMPLTDTYSAAGAFPLFFVWESGFKETILNNKSDLLRDPAFRELVKKVSESVLKKVSIRGAFGFRGGDGTTIEDIDKFRDQYDEWFADRRSEPPSDQTDVDMSNDAVTRASEKDEVALAQEIRRGFDADQKFQSAITEVFNASIPPSDVATPGSGSRARASQLLLSTFALDQMFLPDFPCDRDEKIKTRGGLDWIRVARYVTKIVFAVVKRFKPDRDHGVDLFRSDYLGLTTDESIVPINP